MVQLDTHYSSKNPKSKGITKSDYNKRDAETKVKYQEEAEQKSPPLTLCGGGAQQIRPPLPLLL